MNALAPLALPLLAVIAAAAPPSAPPPALPGTAAGAVQSARLRVDVERLAGFGTRHTLSDTTSKTRGIGAAREWVRAELERAGRGADGRLTAALDPHQAP